jgi:hypothetical protein
MPAMRWSLARMFAMTALVAVASVAAKYFATGGEMMGRLFALASLSILLCAAVGTLSGRVGLGIRFGIAIDLAFLALILLGWMIFFGLMIQF